MYSRFSVFYVVTLLCALVGCGSSGSDTNSNNTGGGNTSKGEVRNQSMVMSSSDQICSEAATTGQRPDLDYMPPISSPRYPSDSGPNIVVDAGHNNFHNIRNRYCMFAMSLRADGYRVNENYDALTSNNLAQTDIYVIANARPSTDQTADETFSESEIEALKNWVIDGGRLMFIIDHPNFLEGSVKLADALGFTVIERSALIPGKPVPYQFDKDSGLLKDHAITDGTIGQPISKFTTFSGSAFWAPDEADILLQFPENSIGRRLIDGMLIEEDISGALQGAVLQFGLGKIAMFSEAGAFTAQINIRGLPMGMGHEDASENSLFLLNVMHWLALN